MLKEKLNNLLEKNNRIIATHDEVNYCYIARNEDLTKKSYKVYIDTLNEKEIKHFIERLEKRNYTFHK